MKGSNVDERAAAQALRAVVDRPDHLAARRQLCALALAWWVLKQTGSATDLIGPSLDFIGGGALTALLIGLGLCHPAIHRLD